MLFRSDKNGCIDFPTLGRIKVAGLTRDQLVDLIQDGLKNQVKDPTVTIQLINFRVTMLGAVQSPGALHVNTERFTILDAVGMAGDLSPKSKRNNVLVVRDKGGEITHGRLDLRSADIFMSEYYYLQQNDIVYVEPNKSAIRDSSTRSEEHTSELQSHSENSYAVFCLKKKNLTYETPDRLPS